MYQYSISGSDIVLRDFFLGFIKIHILYHANKEEIYGIQIIDEIKRHGYKISPGTIYPTLHNLTKNEYLKVVSRNVGGKIRKYYSITPKGKSALEKAKIKINELVKEVIEDVNK